MMNKIIKYIIVIVLAAIVAAIVYFSLRSPEKKSIDISNARINDVEIMARLCVVDIYSEVPVLDTINKKVIFGIQKQNGSVSFDMEKMEIDTVGDTVRITLPPEIVELYESTEPNSWEVIDTKNIGFLGALRSNKLTNEEDNMVKAKIKSNSKKRLYDTGVVRRARSEAARNLENMMTNIYRKPVKVTDPTPEGACKSCR